MALTGLDDLKRELDRLRQVGGDDMKHALLKAAEKIAARQRSLAPTRTGALRASIVVSDGAAPKYASLKGTSRAKKDGHYVVVSAGNTNVRYAHLVEFGSKPHVIKPRFKKALKINGRVLRPGRAVRHPGANKKPFFFPGFRVERRAAKLMITKEMKRQVLDFTKGPSGSYSL